MCTNLKSKYTLLSVHTWTFSNRCPYLKEKTHLTSVRYIACMDLFMWAIQHRSLIFLCDKPQNTISDTILSLDLMFFGNAVCLITKPVTWKDLTLQLKKDGKVSHKTIAKLKLPVSFN